MFNVFAVGIGGAIGSMARYLVYILVQQKLPGAVYPYSTFLVNIVGCFIMGFLGQFVFDRPGASATAKIFLATGVLGGFTTFSAFGNDTITLFHNGHMGYAFLNIAMHMILCIAAAALGRYIGSII